MVRPPSCPPANEAGIGRQHQGERTFRTTSFCGGKLTLWVINCLAVHWLARQLYPQKRTRRRKPFLAAESQQQKDRPKKGAAGSWGRAGRARTRSGDGEGWGRDRARVAPLFVCSQRAVAVSGTGRGSPSATQTFGSDCDWRLTKR